MIEQLSLLYEFNYWGRDRILAVCDHLTADQLLAEAPTSFGSVRNTLVHILNAEWTWRVRCVEGISPAAMLSFEDFPTVQAIRTRWAREKSAMRQYLVGIGDEDLEQIVEYLRAGGQPNESRLWQVLMHVIMHGIEHRSEVAGVVTGYGLSPGDVDFIHFLRR